MIVEEGPTFCQRVVFLSDSHTYCLFDRTHRKSTSHLYRDQIVIHKSVLTRITNDLFLELTRCSYGDYGYEVSLPLHCKSAKDCPIVVEKHTLIIYLVSTTIHSEQIWIIIPISE